MDEAEAPQEEQDIDFHCMSYDVGHEKPDKRMFSAAESMLAKIIESRKHQLASDEAESLESNWTKILVGDEYEKDVEGSINAGWNAILLDPATESPRISRLEDHLDLSLANVTDKGPVMRVQSIGKLATWLAQS
jgi:FMN phosphatase YigB (HAD superfamily)